MLNVLDYFEKTCKKYKDKTAIIYENEKITYNDLLNKSKSIGTYLKEDMIVNKPVIVFMNKSIEAIESFLGVLYAGGCYSLINPDFPKERILQIKETLNTNIILTTSDLYEYACSIFKKCIVIDVQKININIDEEYLENIKNKKIDLDPVYINFTSGSTGMPKGVVVSNRSIIDFINEFTILFNIKDKDIVANQAPLDFDVSVKDIYSSFFKGATLLLIPKTYFSNPSLLLDYLVDNKATTLIWAVSALCLITTFHGLDYKVPSNVNKVIFSGEVMPTKHLKIWMNKLPNAVFVNVYGPTEITCNCTYHIIDRKRDYKDIIPIGKTFKNERVFLLDDNNNIIEKKGIQGEICVSGTCLALGYYNNEEQTNKSFTNNPLNSKYFERIYRTGDYGKYNEKHELLFCGRKDFQIKYMGHRIELEEIDKKIQKQESIIRSCTIFDSEKEKLYSFYIGDIESKYLKTLLLNKLPAYMIPSKVIKVEEFPLTKNGKTDRKKLLEIIKGEKHGL